MIQEKISKSTASHGGTETLVCNSYPYQVPVMVGTNYYTNKKKNFYKSMVQVILRVGGDCATKVESLCDRFVDMGYLVKT